MKRINNMAIILILISASIASSIIPGQLFYSHLEQTELTSEMEFNEVKEVEEAITSRTKTHKFKTFNSPKSLNHNSPFSSALVSNTRNAISINTPKFIQFCSYLN